MGAAAADPMNKPGDDMVDESMRDREEMPHGGGAAASGVAKKSKVGSDKKRTLVAGEDDEDNVPKRQRVGRGRRG